jgi:aminopeptidase N
MPQPDPRTVYLADYQPFPYLLDQVRLTFQLHSTATRVQASLDFAPNPARSGKHDLRLDGEGLRLIFARIGGRDVAVRLDDEGLTIAAQDLPDGAYRLETEVEISPASNTALEGLYMSNGMY